MADAPAGMGMWKVYGPCQQHCQPHAVVTVSVQLDTRSLLGVNMSAALAVAADVTGRRSAAVAGAEKAAAEHLTEWRPHAVMHNT